jgi:crotonobetainyl-CoA:carnitine CoA-transferase CaiB-like acyl-CoA transferase
VAVVVTAAAYAATMASTSILADVKVLDFTQYVAGPTVTRLMAALGAYVVKVEQAPIGDLSRLAPWRRDERSSCFVQHNRGKRSLAVDLDDPRGLDLVRQLVPQVDVVVENYGPGVMERRGLGWDDLRRLHPGLIMASVSAFGRESPLAHRVGFDPIAQAYSGLMHMIGEPDGPPTAIGIAVCDTTTGVNCFGALGYALYHRERTGIGQYVDISLVDTMLQNHELGLTAHAVSDGAYVPRRIGRHHALVCPCGVFRGPEYWIVLLCMDNQWPNLCRAMGRPDLEHDPRFADGPLRAEHQVELIALIEAWMADQGTDDAVMAAFEGHRVPAERVRTPVDALHDEHYLARGMIDRVVDPVLGEVPAPGVPLKFSASTVLSGLPAPLLGEHNREVLSTLLSWDDARLDALHDEGVLVSGPR